MFEFLYKKIDYHKSYDLEYLLHNRIEEDFYVDFIEHKERRFFSSQAIYILKSLGIEGREILRQYQFNRIGLYILSQKMRLPSKLYHDYFLPENRGKNLADFLKSNYDPKVYSKNSASFISATLSLELQISGPLRNFHSLEFGASHAFEMAQFELERGIVDVALIAADYSPTDMQNMIELHRRFQIRSFTEATACCIIKKTKVGGRFYNKITERGQVHWTFGIVGPLIQILEAE